MNIAQIRPLDVANGPGIRVSVFFSGCTHGCPNCFNRDYWDFAYGEPYTETQLDYILTCLDKPVIEGLTLLGGEPLQQNPSELSNFLKAVKTQSNKNIWLYTGYIYENLLDQKEILNALQWVDVLVDGPYIEAQKNLRLAFRGSNNQRLIDLQQSRKKGTAVLFHLM